MILKVSLRFRVGLLCLVAAGALLLAPVSSASAQAVRSGPTISEIPQLARGNAIAFDSVNRVYLVIATYGTLYGRFVAEDGTPLGVRFQIQTSGNFTHFPGVAFAADADSGFGAFLVSWHESDMGGGPTSVHARLVSYIRGGPLGADKQIATDGSNWEAEHRVAVAYSTRSHEFLVAWSHYVTPDVYGLRLDTTATVKGSTFAIAASSDWEGRASAAYDSATDQFLVSYSGYHMYSNGTGFAYVDVRLVQAGTGQLIGGAATRLVQSGATFITDTTYNSATNQFLVSWFDGAYSSGRVVNADGTLPGNVIILSARWKANDALSVGYNTLSGTFFLVSHDPTSIEDGGVELQPTGIPVDNGFRVTAGGGTGNFYPRIAPSTVRGDWLISTSNSFTSTMAQLIHTDTLAGAPPPPPCTPMTVAPLSIGFYAVGGPATIDVTTGTCSWSAASGASWITVTAGTSGTGPGAVTISVARNTGTVGRSASLAIAGKTITITQQPTYAAALSDVNNDGVSDLVFYRQSDRMIGLWFLSGTSVIGTQTLNGSADPSWQLVGSGDLNGDGFADFVWRNTVTGNVAAWLQGPNFPGGSGQALLSVPTVADPGWKIRGVGDVNGDGKADLIWQHDTNGGLAVWYMNGFTVTSTLWLTVDGATPVVMPDPAWRIVGAGDIDRDGKADIVWRNEVNGALGAWLLRGNVIVGQQSLTFGGSATGVSDLNWRIGGVGDVNGDGFADLVWENAATGAMGVWYLVGYDVVFEGGLMLTASTPAVVTDLNWSLVGPG